MVNGKLYYSLIKDYTDDGGHLNDIGQQVIASKLINKLLEIITLKNVVINYIPNVNNSNTPIK